MKKLFALLFMSTLVSQFCFSQKIDEIRKQWILAVFGGLNGSFIHGEGDSWKGVMPGGQFGLMLSFDRSRNDRTVLSGETAISMQGSKYQEQNLDGKVRLNYLNFPMMVQRRSPKGLYGEAGIQPGFLLGAKDTYNGVSYDYKDQSNKFDFGIPIGVGYVVKRKAGISLRYTFGLSNVNKSDYDDNKDHNGNFALRFFYYLAARP